MRIIYLASLVVGMTLVGPGQWQTQSPETKADFRGLACVSTSIAWASGTKGTVVRTSDGGKTWVNVSVPNCEKLDFRDIEAFGEQTAYAMSAGPGEASRIYKTQDGGKSWTLQLTNPEKEGFFDAIAFWDENHGIVMGDPIRGGFQLLITHDGGKNWKAVAADNIPPALPKEGAFAASGTCLITQGESDAWFCTGGAKTARVFHTRDRGQSWTVTDTPIGAGVDSAGIFAVSFRDRNHGIVVGGDYRKPNAKGRNAARTEDGGKTWKLIENSFPFCSGVAWAKDRWMVLGTAGSHFSPDDGKTWTPIDSENYNAIALDPSGIGWAVGPKGRVARFLNQ